MVQIDHVLEVSGLSFGYGGQKKEKIMEQVCFNLAKGDFAVVTGANGAGKSTLLQLILGFLPVANGDIQLFGESVRKFRSWHKIGYVPQKIMGMGEQFPATVLEVVTANLYKKIGLFRFPGRMHKEAAIQALQKVGMERLQGQLIGRLSGGQTQRVMLARALVNMPDLLVLDEPSAGVDIESSEMIYQLLDDLCRKENKTVLMVTHDLDRALSYVNRIFCLDEEGTICEIRSEKG